MDMVFTIASCLCPLSRVVQMGLLAIGPEFPLGQLCGKLVVSSAGEAYDAQGERSRSEIPVTSRPPPEVVAAFALTG